jgi:transcriptional regulator with XRE-family HTH domain
MNKSALRTSQDGDSSMAKLRIKELAQARGLKQYQLAERSGVTPQLLNRYWNNHTQSVALDQLEKIARALGVKAGDLIVDELAHPQAEKETA